MCYIVVTLRHVAMMALTDTVFTTNEGLLLVLIYLTSLVRLFVDSHQYEILNFWVLKK